MGARACAGVQQCSSEAARIVQQCGSEAARIVPAVPPAFVKGWSERAKQADEALSSVSALVYGTISHRLQALSEVADIFFPVLPLLILFCLWEEQASVKVQGL